MEYRRLGRTDVMVSELCLGTMTWGTQNSEAEGHAQIDMSLDHGVNFIDTAEIYPTTPQSVETQGSTEDILGTWLAANKSKRGDVIVATKVAGAGAGNIADRKGRPITPETIREAIETSLKRLQTDYIDLYQFHWPNRGSYHFRAIWDFSPTGDDRQGVRDSMLECLQTMGTLVREGKVRHFGTSNETVWGIAQFLELAEANGLPRMVSVQNEYSLLARYYDTDMAEMTMFENVGLLAYSPIACGLLSGKYRDGATPAGSRKSINDTLAGRITPQTVAAVEGYAAIADKHGLDLTQMSLAWCLTRPFMTSVIYGATNLEQLETVLGSANVTLSDAVLAEIQDVRRQYPMPM